MLPPALSRLTTPLRQFLHRSRSLLLLGLFAMALFTSLHLPLQAQLPASSDPFQLYNQGQFEAARQVWEKTANAAAQTGDRATEITNRINEVQALKALGAYVRAEQVVTNALNTVDRTTLNQQAEQRSLQTLKVKLLRSLGEIYLAQGDIDRARTQLTRSLELAQPLADSNQMGAIYYSLGMTERAAVWRTATRLLQSTGPLSGVQQGAQLAALQQLLQPTLPSKELTTTAPEASLAAVTQAFQQALQSASDPTTRFRAELSQLSLIVDLLPRLNQYLGNYLNQVANELTGTNSDYFINTFIADPTLVKDLTPLVSLFGQVRQLENAPDPTSVQPLAALAQVQLRVRELTDAVINQGGLLAGQGAQLPNTVEAAESHVHYAQTLLRLKPIADTADRVDTQLREHLRSVLATVQTYYTVPEYQKKLPPRSRFDPVFKKVRTDLQMPQRSLFLLPTTRSALYQQAQGSLQQATQVLAPSLATARTLNNPRLEATVNILLATVYSTTADFTGDTQRWADVEVLAKRALQLVQAENDPDLILRAQQQYARSLVKQSKTTAAQAACRVATTTLQVNRRNLVAINQDVQYSFLETVDPFYRECVVALLSGTDQTPEQRNLADARDLIEALQLAELDNFFREACIEGQKTAIDTLIDQPQNAKTAVIYPILLAKRKVGVIVRLPNVKALQYYTTETPNQDIESTLFRFSAQLTDPRTSTAVSTRSLGATIYSWLIQNIRSQLTGVDTLVFVPDAAFRNTPMAALYDQASQKYLIDDFAIALSPGLQLTQTTANQSLVLKAIGAGLIDIPTQFQLTAFPKAVIEQEFNTLKRVGILDQPPLLETEFTSQELINQLQRNPFNVVHLSTHAAFSSQKEKTYVLMANGRINVDDFSAILRKRVQQNGAIELLVLSACDTASGDRLAALGLAGIAIRSGARSTMATLWAVEPAATAKFMDSFYAAYVKAPSPTVQQPKAKALQAAQLQLKQEGADPSVWASYILVGSWL